MRYEEVVKLIVKPVGYRIEEACLVAYNENSGS